MRPFEGGCLADRPAEVATLLATGAGRSFATSAAFEHALDRFDPPGDRRCFVLSLDGKPVAALPGRLERRFGGTWLRAQPHGTPAGPVFAPSLSAEERVAAATLLWLHLDYTSGKQGWLGGDVTLYGPAATDPALWPDEGKGRIRTDVAHVIDLSQGVEAWRASLANASRRMIAQADRREVTIERTSAASDLDATYALFLEQARRWGLKRVRPAAFYRALLEAGASLWVARLEGRIVCGVLGFVAPEETYLWWSGSSPDARPVRAYPATIARIAEECGSARVNLGFSGGQSRLSDFKEGLGARPLEVPIVELRSQARTPWHALLAGYRNAAKRRRERAR